MKRSRTRTACVEIIEAGGTVGWVTPAMAQRMIDAQEEDDAEHGDGCFIAVDHELILPFGNRCPR